MVLGTLMRFSFAAVACVFAALSVAGPAAADKEKKPKADRPLASVMSCLRGSKDLVVTARVGGGATVAPENSMAALNELLPYAAAMQIDVAAAVEGTLYLMRDATIDRTTTGRGGAGDVYWEDLKSLRLKNKYGVETDQPIPTFNEALDWSAGKAILLVDKRMGATWAEIIQAVKLKGAENRVIAMVRSPVEVAEIRRLSDKVGVRFDLTSADDWKRLRDLDVKSNTLIGWTSGAAKPELWKDAKKKVVVGYTTAGAAGKSYDETITASGDFNQYNWFAQQGVTFILTDNPQLASQSKNAKKGREHCLGR
jgi:glycerophosphoryl diester phosphodiesterase